MEAPAFVVPASLAKLLGTISDQTVWAGIEPIMSQIARFEIAARGTIFWQGQDFRTFVESDSVKKLTELAFQLGKQQNFVEALDWAGWLPHTLLPYEAIMAELKSSFPDVDGFVTNYILDNWELLENQLRNRAMACDLDKDTLSAFDEALQAHGHGLYRASCRTIFPELERIFRQELMLTGRSDKVVKKFIDRALQCTLRETGSYGLLGLRMFEFLVEGCYGQVRGPESAPSLPNRHAVLHGFGIYATAKDSLNCLFVADFVFHLVAAIKASSLSARSLLTQTQP